MWISVMNLLTCLGFALLVLFTIIGIYAYRKERLSWHEIEAKAEKSGLNAFDE